MSTATEIISDLLTDGERAPHCEAPSMCPRVAVARFVALCVCKRMRLACQVHLDATARLFDAGAVLHCTVCHTDTTEYRVVWL